MSKNNVRINASLLLIVMIVSCSRIMKPEKSVESAGTHEVIQVEDELRSDSTDKRKKLKQIDKFDVSSYSGQVIKDITFATGLKTFQGTEEDLQLDIYMPEDQVAGKKYPLILFAHGGALLVGSKDASAGYCAGYASNGFVTATINYRLGWEKDRDVFCSGDSTQMKQALYRAVQDARAALRFLVHNANEYAIDTSWIFITGPSAGGAITMQATYLTQKDGERFLPGVSNTLGLLDNSGNELKDKFTIKGCANLWGGIGDINLITKYNAVPCINFHGELDKVSPYAVGNMYNCNLYMTIYGSRSIYEKLKSLDVPTIVHIDPKGGHGVYGQNFIINNTVCFFKSYMEKKSIDSKYITQEVSSCN